jgi:hypothetical protein
LIGERGESKTIRVFSLDELAALFRANPREPGELPKGLGCLLDYSTILKEANEARQLLGECEWFPPIVWILQKLEMEWLVNEGLSATDGELLSLEVSPDSLRGALRTGHEMGHRWYKKRGIKHEEGDVFLWAMALLFPPRFFFGSNAKLRVMLCRHIPTRLLIAWGQQWNYEDLPLLFPGEDVEHPDIARERRAQQRERERLLARRIGRR